MCSVMWVRCRNGIDPLSPVISLPPVRTPRHAPMGQWVSMRVWTGTHWWNIPPLPAQIPAGLRLIKIFVRTVFESGANGRCDLSSNGDSPEAKSVPPTAENGHRHAGCAPASRQPTLNDRINKGTFREVHANDGGVLSSNGDDFEGRSASPPAENETCPPILGRVPGNQPLMIASMRKVLGNYTPVAVAIFPTMKTILRITPPRHLPKLQIAVTILRRQEWRTRRMSAAALKKPVLLYLPMRPTWATPFESSLA